MKYAVGIGSGAMIYVPIFIKISSGIQNLINGDTHTYTHTHRQQSLLYFFEIKKIG
jgi:hypothetical protein